MGYSVMHFVPFLAILYAFHMLMNWGECTNQFPWIYFLLGPTVGCPPVSVHQSIK